LICIAATTLGILSGIGCGSFNLAVLYFFFYGHEGCSAEFSFHHPAESDSVVFLHDLSK